MSRTASSLATLLAVPLALLAAPVQAQEPKSLGNFTDWSAFSFQEGNRQTCYMVSQPKNQEGLAPNARRGDVYVMVTHRPNERSLDVVSVLAGYTFQQGSEATAQIGNQTFRLFTDGDGAWARDESTDRQVVGAMRGGQTMIVRGQSNRGTRTTDTYSLRGFSAAYQAINQACNVKR
jgi:invasion protein IalB